MKDAQEYIQMMLPFSSHMNVLYVEDDEELRKNMQELLSNLFKEVVTTSDGEEALKLLAQNNFDILITDINMPRMNGIELIKEIKIKNPNQMIVVLSAYNQPNYLLPLLKMGVNNYILKPFDLQKFSMTLLRSILIFQENKAKNEKERLLKEEIYTLKKENRKLKKLLQNSFPNEEKEQIPKAKMHEEANSPVEQTINILGIDPILSAQKIDDLIESIDFLANRLKGENLKKEDIVSIGDLYFDLSKEFALLGSLDIYSIHLKDLAFGLYDPDFSLENLEKIKHLFFIINDHLQHWIEQVLLQQTTSVTLYSKEELNKDVSSILDLAQFHQ